MYETTDTLSILGQLDSARYFRISHHDSDGNVIDSELNGQPIIISKQFGLVQFFVVDSFPTVLKPVYLIGNVSPMVGLFGTVFGMIKLFNTIVTAGGQPQPAQLADGISIALVTTLWGLFIAIPALAIHGVFRNRIETLASDAVTEAENIMPEIRRSLKKLQSQQQTEPLRTGKTKQPPVKSGIQEFTDKSTGSVRQTLHSRE